MVQILVQNVNLRRVAYNIVLSDPISNLKGEIEEIEGIPVEQQKLEFGELQLEDDKTYDSYGITDDSILYLNIWRITVLTLTGTGTTVIIGPETTGLELKYMMRDILRIPIDQQRMVIKRQIEDSLTLSSYGVQNGSRVHLTLMLRGGGGGYEPFKAYATARFNWDGDMKDRAISGLQLVRGKVYYVDDLIHVDWFRGWDGENIKGVFPRNHVKISRILDDHFRTQLSVTNINDPLPVQQPQPIPTAPVASVSTRSKILGLFCCTPSAEDILETREPAEEQPVEDAIIEVGPPPTVPNFPYPAIAPLFFTLELGEKGLSFVQVAVSFRPLSLPARRAQVDAVLKCSAAHPRRISSVVLSLAFPENDVGDIQPTVEFGPETATDIEMKDNRVVSLEGGFDREGATVKAGWKHESEEIQSATRHTQMKISGMVKNANTAFWSLTEDIGQGGKGGLPDQVPMSFTLGYKPAQVAYECRVTSVKDGKERERYAGQSRRI